MTTIVDPLGSPTVFYNKSGTVIQNVNGAGTTGGAATLLSGLTECSVIIVTTSVGQTGVKLPADADTNVGDVIEFYPVASPDPQVYDNSGSLMASVGGNFYVIRKTAANTWHIVSKN